MSIVVLTWNEEENIRACLDAIARQTVPEVEVIVVDAASRDATVRIVRQVATTMPQPLRLHEFPDRAPIGTARNQGIALAKAPVVAFVSADAIMEPDWVEFALASLSDNDVVFGRQVHAPRRWTLAAAVRSLQYNFPSRPAEDPLRFASNVCAAYRREVLEDFSFDPGSSAVEDLLLAQRAHVAGYRITYNPSMVVRHFDVGSTKAEFRKRVREGVGWGTYATELGYFRELVAWAIILLVLLALLSVWPGAATGFALLAALWLPAARRAYRRRRDMPWPQIAKGLAAAPLFDLVFLACYFRGLLIPPPPPAQPGGRGGNAA